MKKFLFIVFSLVLITWLPTNAFSQPVDINIDARSLTAQFFRIYGVASELSTETIQSVSLEPGQYGIYTGHYTDTMVWITVTESGNITYDPSLEGVLNGAGSADLVVNGASITIDATALSADTFSFYRYTELANLSTDKVQSMVLIPGQYRIYTGHYTDTIVWITVTESGNITYDPSLEGVLNGAGSADLVVNGASITIDATALSADTFSFYRYTELANLSTDQVQSMVLIPGQYRIYTGHYTDTIVWITVTESGNITYDPSLEGVLNGAGSADLVVNGASITIDATALSADTFSFYRYTELANLSTDQVQSMVLIPGQYRIYTGHYTDTIVWITVTESGNITYDPSLEGVLNGAGSADLVVNGASITIDATALSADTFSFYRYTELANLSTDKVQSMVLIPGQYRIYTGHYTDTIVWITVTESGNITYDPSLEGVLNGAGSADLVVNGASITIDATALSADTFSFYRYTELANLSTDKVQSMVLIPGQYRIYTGHYTDTIVWITVTESGNITYDPSLEGVLNGAGSADLVVNGASITIDATALSADTFSFYRYTELANLSTDQVQSMVLIPGQYRIYTGHYTDTIVWITVTESGNITYDPSLEGVLNGAGSADLVVNGASITIDATALSADTFSFYRYTELANLSTDQVQSMVLIPGQYRIYTGHYTDTIVWITVTESGNITYDPSLEGVLNGAGSADLVVNGASITIDATALSADTFSFYRYTELANLSTDQLQSLIIIPGEYKITVSNVYYPFSVPSDGICSSFVINTSDGDIFLSFGNCPNDTHPPVTSDIVATPNPVEVHYDITLTAVVDDTQTGGSNIASAEYSIDGGTWIPMVAQDGAFDSPTENVTVTLPAFTIPEVYQICVRGTDDADNEGIGECIFIAVYDPDGGFVTGGGWIMSPAGAYSEDPSLEGKANFGFVSKYKKGATVPTGNTEFQFKAGDLNFHSGEYDWLVVPGGHTAKYKGIGTIDGVGSYKFMIWAQDFEPDTFRIKIWEEDEAESEFVIYDNGFDQEIGGGNIKVHEGN